METPLRAIAPMFAGTVMAATGCGYDDAVSAIASVQAEYGARVGELPTSVDYDGMVRAAIESLRITV